MSTVAAGPDGFVHPRDENDIVRLIHQARSEGAKVRVRGSGHSVPGAISGGAGARTFEVLLDRMIALRLDDATMRATVQAGCHLGRDPSDPTKSSTWENGLFLQLDKHGWAVPDMGGIIHQSVGGFLSTGSAGGSLTNSIYDAVARLRLVDGTGKVHELERDDRVNENPFFGAAISIGLLGVITEVTFKCIPRYHMVGLETTHKRKDAPVDLFGTGTNSLIEMSKQTEHMRVNWWPQKSVDKVVLWKVRRMKPDDYNDETGPPDAFKPRKYELFEKILGSQDVAQTLANKVFRLFGRLNPPPPGSGFSRFLDKTLAVLYAPVVNSFLPTGEKGEKRFWDIWWKALPADNEASDELLPTEFTEAWIPLERAHDALIALRDHYQAGGFDAYGTHTTEFYGAKRSPFWMSPSHGQDVLRFDLFWFAKNEGDPERDYFPQHWKLLDKFEPRYHWGKHLPVAPSSLRSRFARWDDFLRLRAQFDPEGVFLTPFWRERLGI